MSHDGIGVKISALSNNMVSPIESCIIFKGEGNVEKSIFVLNDT